MTVSALQFIFALVRDVLCGVLGLATDSILGNLVSESVHLLIVVSPLADYSPGRGQLWLLKYEIK